MVLRSYFSQHLCAVYVPSTFSKVYCTWLPDCTCEISVVEYCGNLQIEKAHCFTPGGVFDPWGSCGGHQYAPSRRNVNENHTLHSTPYPQPGLNRAALSTPNTLYHLMSTSTQDMRSNLNRDSNALRASVLDVCVQLGATDQNSLVAQWMFSDPNADLHYDERPRPGRVMSSHQHIERPETGVTIVDGKRKSSFSFTSSFAAIFKSKHRTMSRVDSKSDGGHDGNSSIDSPTSRRPSTRRVLLNPGPENYQYYSPEHDTVTSSTSSQRSPHTRSRPRAIRSPTGLASIAELETSVASTVTPSDRIPFPDMSNHDHHHDEPSDDDDWEKVEVRAGSPAYALHAFNKGMNTTPAKLRKPHKLSKRRPPAADLHDTTENNHSEEHNHTTDTPSRKPSIIRTIRKSLFRRKSTPSRTTSLERPRRITTHARSESYPHLNHPLPPHPSPSPRVNTPSDPAYRVSMGYHNQFFTSTPTRPAVRKKSVSFPAHSAQPSSPTGDGRRSPGASTVTTHSDLWAGDEAWARGYRIRMFTLSLPFPQ